MSQTIRFKRIENEEAGETAYEVLADGQSIGFVWSARVFSYRGTEGWNRGLRLRDFHPKEWRYGPSVSNWRGQYGTAASRTRAAKELLRATLPEP